MKGLTVPSVTASCGTRRAPDPEARLRNLLDPGTAIALCGTDDSGVRVASGHIRGTPVVAFCTDPATMGGALGAVGSQCIVDAIDTAVARGCPVIGLWHSGGARLGDGVASLDGVGRLFFAITRASGKVPQISVILGPAAGAAAYGPALTDIVVMCKGSRIFVTGPDVVRSVTGEVIDMEGLGGWEVHGGKSGVTHVVVDSEAEAYREARELTDLLGRPGDIDRTAPPDQPELSSFLPSGPQRCYDVRPLVRKILDNEGDARYVELQPRWAANIVVGLGRLGGRTVGVVANNPIRKGGCLDSLSAEKAARFVRMCDALGVPLLVMVDVPGYLPGVRQEWEGVVRRGAKLLSAFSECVVPRVTLILRKAYGGGYIAMNSRALGATRVFAWPHAEIAVMNAETAVNILHRRSLAACAAGQREQLRRQLVDQHRLAVGGVDRLRALGVVDEIISPAETRRKLAEAIGAATGRRGGHINTPL